jgi:hypothetical protein
MNYQDFLDEGEEITARLYFTRKPAAVSGVPAGEIRLANSYDPDDTRMLLVYFIRQAGLFRLANQQT